VAQVCRRGAAGLPAGAAHDLALLHVSSIYGGPEVMRDAVARVRRALPGVRAVVGGGASGIVGMRAGR
jgi:hypothetical protein